MGKRVGRRAKFAADRRAASPRAHRRLHGRARLEGPVIGLSARRHRLRHRWPHLGRGSADCPAPILEFERFAHLDYVPCPAARRRFASRGAWRSGICMRPASIESPEVLERSWREPQEVRVLKRMIERGLNTPLTSSCGRLFDAVAAVVLGRGVVDYEAQAAIELEGLAVDEPDVFDSGYRLNCRRRLDTREPRASPPLRCGANCCRSARGRRQIAHRRALSRRRCSQPS
jgi:hypothetical protein